MKPHSKLDDVLEIAGAVSEAIGQYPSGTIKAKELAGAALGAAAGFSVGGPVGAKIGASVGLISADPISVGATAAGDAMAASIATVAGTARRLNRQGRNLDAVLTTFNAGHEALGAGLIAGTSAAWRRLKKIW